MVNVSMEKSCNELGVRSVPFSFSGSGCRRHLNTGTFLPSPKETIERFVENCLEFVGPVSGNGFIKLTVASVR